MNVTRKLKREMNWKEMARTNKQTNWILFSIVHFTVSILAWLCYACARCCCLFRLFAFFSFFPLLFRSFYRLVLYFVVYTKIAKVKYAFHVYLYSLFFGCFPLFLRVCICTSVFAFKWHLFVHLNLCLWDMERALLALALARGDAMKLNIWVKCVLTTAKHSACFRLRIAHFIVWLLASLLLLS